MKKIKMKKIKMIPVILIFLLMFNLIQVFAYAYEVENEELADYLNNLGLFKGNSNGYDLDKTATRVQGAVMVVRLLGKEEEALEKDYGHPFTDVAGWADPYVGYLYVTGITKGTSSTTFGSSNLLSGIQYMTLLLRVIEYDDSSGDFSWYNSLEAAYNFDIFTYDEFGKYSDKTTFLRDDLVYFTYAILNGYMHDSSETLYDYLVGEGVILTTTINAADEHNLYEDKCIDTTPSSSEDLQDNVEIALYNLNETVVFNVSNCNVSSYSELLNGALYEIMIVPGYFSMVEAWSYVLKGSTLTLSISYRLTDEELEEAKVTGHEIVESITDEDMTDYEKELAIHDYLVNTITYDDATVIAEESYTLYGALVLKKAVCQGYSEAFSYLCSLADIESSIVIGTAEFSGAVISHAWNQVLIEGEYYFVDVTWDDPIVSSGENRLRHIYFNLTSEELSSDHVWIQEDYQEANGTNYNYYVYNDWVVYNTSDIEDRYKACVESESTSLYLKLVGDTITSSELLAIMWEVPGWKTCAYTVEEEYGIIEIYGIEYW